MHIRFDDRTALVTGAAHGFGREIARQLAALGARVWACDVLPDELEETARVCRESAAAGEAGGGDGGAGARCEVRVVDVTDRDAVAGLVAEVEAEAGVVDVLVNNAGGVLGQVGRPLEDVPVEDWQALFDVNVTGAFNLSQAVVPGMKRTGRGRIVNISSGAGLGVSLTGIQGYAAAKAAQIGLTRQLAHELGPFGITVNNVAPGFVRSNPTTERQWQSYGAEGQKRLVDGIPLRRLGTVADIAHAVLFLTSDYAGWITGEVLRVSGGR